MKTILLGILLFPGISPLFGQEDLTATIKKMDSLYFAAYNACDMETQANFYDENIEFYHDSGGLATDKQALLQSIQDNICGKVSRELLQGSIEVSPVPGFGAVEIGQHSFINHMEGDSKSKPSKFVVIWKDTPEGWKIYRVISLH
ncbi:nuclear transport factor 2 family protein [Robertkochia flava]|uniref:nuclear transport factor 2 family protein n=1 Tax=Robertkochia flava TaxID=3447986 RepID=UPI001CCEE1DB|nr:nuclear transport factor 2 family protein [Robertkochia marina]